MNNCEGILLCLLLCSGPHVAAQDGQSEWVREVETDPLSQTELIKFPLNSEVYLHSQATLLDLSIVDSAGTRVPFLIRNESRHITKDVTQTWEVEHPTLKPVATGGLEIRFELEENDAQPSGINLITSLRNFEQRVQVFGIDNSVVETPLVKGAVIYDYARYMDVRNTRIPLPANNSRRFRIAIDLPTSTQQSELLEITKLLRAGDEVSREVRTTVEQRPFRIDRIQLWTDQTDTLDELVEDHAYNLIDTKISVNETSHQTVIDLLTSGEPLTGFQIETDEKNFFRSAKVSTVGGKEIQEITSQPLKRFAFRELQDEQLMLHFQPNRSRNFQIVIDNHDNPPLHVTGVKALGRVDEVIFLANADETYQLIYGNAAAMPVQLDVPPLAAALNEGYNPILARLGEAHMRSPISTRNWMQWKDIINNPFLIGAVVLVMLGVLGWLLFVAAQRIEAVDEPGETEI